MADNKEFNISHSFNDIRKSTVSKHLNIDENKVGVLLDMKIATKYMVTIQFQGKI